MTRRQAAFPEICDAIVERVDAAFGEAWGLKLVQVGGLEWLFAPALADQDLDALLPCVLVEMTGDERQGDAKLQSDSRVCQVRLRLAMPMVDLLENPRILLQRLRALHAEFLKEDLSLDVTGLPAGSFGLRDCRARSAQPSTDSLELLGIIAGEVDLEVRYSADPYVP